ncbi:MAG TPA: hypothetical protein VGI40_05915 [Pirellulaceae bacterium]|jgi:hypothetical protein
MTSHSHDSFKQRERGLEEAFFQERDRQLLEKLRSHLAAMEHKAQLAHVTGIVEDHVLASLTQAGVRAETLAAVVLIPLVEVAWCDGTVAPEERDAILNAASQQGIHRGSPSRELLEHWLTARPDSRIINAWKEYVHELARIMPGPTLETMKKNLLHRLHNVASAAGGFLGLVTISKHEQQMMDEIAKAWEV